MSDLELLDKLLQEAGLRVLFGLRQQGKYDTVAAMRADFKPWDEIGKAIGWSGDAVERCYEIETRHELERLRGQIAEAEARGREAVYAEIRKVGPFVLIMHEWRQEASWRCVFCNKHHRMDCADAEHFDNCLFSKAHASVPSPGAGEK